MVYSKKFVVALKCNGKVLREEEGSVVRLPFGSDYSLLLKNLNSVKAVVSIEIDGESVTDNKKIIVNPNSTVELKGFLDGQEVKHSFRFIEKTKEVEKHRGNKLDDGLIRVEVQFEEEYNLFDPFYFVTDTIKWYYSDSTPDIHYNYSMQTYNYSSDGNEKVRSITYSNSNPVITAECSNLVGASQNSIQKKNDDGITVHGKDVDQQFQRGYVNALNYEKIVLVIHLKGMQNQKKITKPQFVSTKKQCTSCGKKSISSFKFCPNCGTRL